LQKGLEKVGNPNVLVNIISRRVRQLNMPAAAAWAVRSWTCRPAWAWRTSR
jgi:DNA-directed RNA polymerase subunit K/omega